MNLAYERQRAHQHAALKQAGLEAAWSVQVVRAERARHRISPVSTRSSSSFGRQLFRNRHVDSAYVRGARAAAVAGGGAFDVIMALAYPTMAGVLQRAGRPAAASRPRIPRLCRRWPGVGTPTRPTGGVRRARTAPATHRSDVGTKTPYSPTPAAPGATSLDPRGREIFDRLVGNDAGHRATRPRRHDAQQPGVRRNRSNNSMDLATGRAACWTGGWPKSSSRPPAAR